MGKKHHNYRDYSGSHNYTNYSNPQNRVEPEVIETTLISDGEVVAEIVEPVVEEEIVETEENVPAPAAPIIGVVTDCVKLNVRKEPSLDAPILRTILLATEVVINEEESTEDFYKVYVEGLSGFCLKAKINIIA